MASWIDTASRVLACLLLACLPVLASCGETSWSPGKPLAKEHVKIGVLYLDRADTGGYSFAHEQGIRTMRENLALREDQIIRKFDVSESEPMMIEHKMRECIAAGANIIIATSWGYMDVCAALAEEFPGVVFAHASGYKSNAKNFTNYFGRIYQARYLSGLVAGLKTNSGKIGYVAAMDNSSSEVTGGLNAFALGVERVNPEARIYVEVTHSWYDPTGERLATRQLLSKGCDVIAQHCDTPNPQIEAQRAGVCGIGYNSDMSLQAPRAVMTSVVWNWEVYYTALVRSVIDGSFTTTPYYGGLAEGLVDITPLNPALAPEGAERLIEQARLELRKGSFNVFDGCLRTCDGRVLGTDGGTLSDSEIVGGIDWYYHSIVGAPSGNDGSQ